MDAVSTHAYRVLIIRARVGFFKRRVSLFLAGRLAMDHGDAI